MNDDATLATLSDLFPDLPKTRTHRWKVEILLNRDGGDATPDEDQAIAELAAVIMLARGLVTGWTSRQSLITIIVDAASAADALEVGAAVVRALDGGRQGARIEVEPARPQ